MPLPLAVPASFGTVFGKTDEINILVPYYDIFAIAKHFEVVGIGGTSQSTSVLSQSISRSSAKEARVGISSMHDTPYYMDQRVSLAVVPCSGLHEVQIRDLYTVQYSTIQYLSSRHFCPCHSVRGFLPKVATGALASVIR